MRLVIHSKQVLHRELGVTLRRGKAFMTEHLLDSSQVGAFLEHVGAEGVPKSVGMDVGRESFCDGNFLNDPAYAPGGELSPALIDEQGWGVLVQVGQDELSRRQIGRQR